MEPSFVATPYAQASSPQSRQIRAWLDDHEASYEQWRSSRKPVKHAFATSKLNSPARCATKAMQNSASAPARTPSRHALSNQATANTATTTRLRPDTSSGRLGLAYASRNAMLKPIPTGDPVLGTTTLTYRITSLRRQAISAPALPAIAKSCGMQQQHPDSNNNSVRLAPLPHLAAAASTAERMRVPARVRTPALAKKRLQEHLYDFHSRQVFSLASNPEDDSDTLSDSETSLDLTADKPQDRDASSSSVHAPDVHRAPTENNTEASAMEVLQPSCMLEGVAFMAPQDYAHIFEHDWRLSDADSVVRDAVERQRIRAVLQSSYRELLWFFRYYAGKTALASGTGRDLFRVSNRLELLEDVNVQCIDPTRFGITDTLLRRDAFVSFLLSAAKMMSSHSGNPERMRVLAAEGLELSNTMKMLVRDHFCVYAQLQDVNHFRFVFLRKIQSSSDSARRIENILNKHRVNIENFFRESIRAPVAAGGIITSTGNSMLPSSSQLSMTFAQFLAALRALGLIASSKATSATTGAVSAAIASAPGIIEEGRALRVFLSCLTMRASDCADRDAGAVGVGTREVTLAQFTEALLRVALVRRERSVCRGNYDVCPGELASELCACTPESAQCDFAAFDDAVDELFATIHAFRLKHAHRRAAMKIQPLHAMRLAGMQPSLLRARQHVAIAMSLRLSGNRTSSNSTEGV